MTKVLALNTSLRVFEAFASEAEAVARCPGLEIAEGDWLFFDESGAPLEAHFSKSAYVDSASNVYGHGIYSFRKGNGASLTECLFKLCADYGTLWFGTSEALQVDHGGDQTD